MLYSCCQNSRHFHWTAIRVLTNQERSGFLIWCLCGDEMTPGLLECQRWRWGSCHRWDPQLELSHLERSSNIAHLHKVRSVKGHVTSSTLLLKIYHDSWTDWFSLELHMNAERCTGSKWRVSLNITHYLFTVILVQTGKTFVLPWNVKKEKFSRMFTLLSSIQWK